jgi:hypothetical protein
MSPLFIIAFVHCANAGPCQITDVAPYLRYGNYEACISDARLYDVPALRRQFGAPPTCVDATQAQRPDAPDLGMLDKKLDKTGRVVSK